METFWEREAAESRLRVADRVRSAYGAGVLYIPQGMDLGPRFTWGVEAPVVVVPPVDSGSNAQASALRRYWTTGPGSRRGYWPRHRRHPLPEHPISGCRTCYRRAHYEGRHRR